MGPLAAAALSLLLGSVHHVRHGEPAGGDGSIERPHARIADALAHAASGDSVELAPGLYEEAVVVPRGVALVGKGQAVVAAPPGSATALQLAEGTRVEDVTVQGGRTGILAATGRSSLRNVSVRGQPDVGIAVARGARLALTRVQVESSFASAIGIRDEGEAEVDDVSVQGPFRRAIDASGGTLRGHRLALRGANTGLHSVGGQVNLRELDAQELRGPCVFASGGALTLTGPVLAGCEYGVQAREGAHVVLREATLARCWRAAVSMVQSELDARDVTATGTAIDAAITVDGGRAHLADVIVRSPGETGLRSRLASLQLERFTVIGARPDRDGDGGNALFLFDVTLDARDLEAVDCAGGAVESQLGSGRIAGLLVDKPGLSGVALEHGAKLDLDGLEVRDGSGAGLACIEGGQSRVRVARLGTLGAPYLVDCSCRVEVWPRPATPPTCSDHGGSRENPAPKGGRR